MINASERTKFGKWVSLRDSNLKSDRLLKLVFSIGDWYRELKYLGVVSNFAAVCRTSPLKMKTGQKSSFSYCNHK